jgi:aerobic carbon-monoxide dehydrogenase medium subunit
MQVPAPFEYERASSVDDAVALLERHGEDARLIAGGHSLLPLMKLRLAEPEMLMDINGVTDLQTIIVDGDTLRIGSMVRHAELLASAVVGEHYAILRDAEQVIADPVVRNRGTVGGSLCQADPAEDLSAAFGALRAEVVIRGSAGERVVPVRELVTGPYETVVGPAEIVTEIRLPLRPGAGSSYLKVERRAGDYAIASAGAVVWLDGDTITEVGLGLAAVGAASSVAPYIAVVDVDAGTGVVKVRRFIAVDDCGPRINPMIVEGQIHGGLADGIGMALMEVIAFDLSGNCLGGPFMDYQVPTAMECPSWELGETVTPSPHHPLGVKGVGESATVGSPPAIVNAVVDALKPFGIRHVDMPMTPAQVWRAI